MSGRVVVVGAGIIGLSCAVRLQQEGYAVTIVDRNEPGDSACAASCGSIAVSEVLPLSRSGVLRRMPRWIVDPTGPMAVRSSALLGSIPWFLRFAANARPERVERISRDLAGLTRSARADLETMLTGLGLRSHLRDTPVIELFDTESDLAAQRPHHVARRALGFKLDEVSGREAAELEPAIAGDFAKAVIMSDWCSINDARGILVALARTFAANGGTVVRAAATRVHISGTRATGIETDTAGRLDGEHFVLAAGVWTPELTSSLGVRLMVEAASGYSTIVPDGGMDMKHSVIYARGGFGISPYGSGLAIAGGIELAGRCGAPNWHRAALLVKQARRVLPALKQVSGEQRFGRRPLTPDTLPIIDRVPGIDNAVIATGHGQLGLTLCATTARLVLALVAGTAPHIDLLAFSATRFAR